MHENGKETKIDTEMRKGESIQDSKDAIAEYNDNDWYLAYVSINDIVDYRDFIEWYQKLSDDKELEWGELWCAVHTEDADGYCVEPNIGFCPYPSGMSMNWDREKYPYLSLLDNTDICHDVDVTDEETMQTHFISMLSYIQDYDDIISMMGQTTDSPNRYQDMINYVKKNGLNPWLCSLCKEKRIFSNYINKIWCPMSRQYYKIKKEVQIYQKRYFCTF